MLKIEAALILLLLTGLGVAGVVVYRKFKVSGAEGTGRDVGTAVVKVADGVATGVVGGIGDIFGLPKPETLSSNPCDCNTFGTNCTAAAFLSKITGGCKVKGEGLGAGITPQLEPWNTDGTPHGFGFGA